MSFLWANQQRNARENGSHTNFTVNHKEQPYAFMLLLQWASFSDSLTFPNRFRSVSWHLPGRNHAHGRLAACLSGRLFLRGIQLQHQSRPVLLNNRTRSDKWTSLRVRLPGASAANGRKTGRASRGQGSSAVDGCYKNAKYRDLRSLFCSHSGCELLIDLSLFSPSLRVLHKLGGFGS
jgi:hypothetical protein